MQLAIHTRTVFGKKVGTLRRTGFIPGEVFGHGVKNLHVSVVEKDFSKVYRDAGEHTIVTLATESGEKIPALITNVAYNHITQKIIAVDFHQIKMDEVIEANVPLVFTGEAPALKLGFLVIKVHDEIPIEALPLNIPHSIEVSLTSLADVGNSIHITDIQFGKDVKVLLPSNTVLATVTEKAKEEVVAQPVTEEPTEGEKTTETTEGESTETKTE